MESAAVPPLLVERRLLLLLQQATKSELPLRCLEEFVHSWGVTKHRLATVLRTTQASQSAVSL